MYTKLVSLPLKEPKKEYLFFIPWCHLI